MDAWCALWFWPLDKAGLVDGSDPAYQVLVPSPEPVPVPAKQEETPLAEISLGFPQTLEQDSLFGDSPKQLTLGASVSPRQSRPKPPAAAQRSPVPLANLDDWLDFAEALLGRQDIPVNSLAGNFTSLSELAEYEDQLDSEFYLDMDPVNRLPERFPWLSEVEEIARQQGFFHWELRFASVFAEGGFDIQVGNPPWVRPRWEESPVLAEIDPWFELAADPPASEQQQRRSELLADGGVRSFYLTERTLQSAQQHYFSLAATNDLLVGTQPDLYRAFMIRTWRNIGRSGVVGLLHPDTHFVGEAEKYLRASAYAHLRVHGDFVNSGNRFFPPPVNRSSHFGMHIYGYPKEIGFFQLGWLLDAVELPESLRLFERGITATDWDDRSGIPGIKYQGDWDARPHPARVIWVDSSRIATWRLISGLDNEPIEYAKLLNPVTVYEQGAIIALSRVRCRLVDLLPRITRGYDEANDKTKGLIEVKLWDPPKWAEVLLKGPRIGVATPFFKQPPNTGTRGRPQNLVALDSEALPRSLLARSAAMADYQEAQDQWIDYSTGERRICTEFYRLIWRRMIPDDTDRSLFSALYPPGPAHVHSVHSLALPSNRGTVLVAGFWAGLPLDYLLRITVTTDLQTANTLKLPAPELDHPLASSLLLRTLRLNCLTSAYADLWEELYEDAWRTEQWVVGWPLRAPLGDLGKTWERGTALRTELERRAALVEIDALVAVWLDISEEQLEAIYPARYPILGDYEDVTWFDANGRKIAGNWNTFGTGQTKEDWQQFQLYLEDQTKNPPPEGYEPPFYKADRIGEFRQAHAAFSERLGQAASGN